MNQIEAIPAEFGMLTSLQELNLRTNWLTELPPEIGALVSLQNFDVSHNRLDAELPNSDRDIEGFDDKTPMPGDFPSRPDRELNLFDAI